MRADRLATLKLPKPIRRTSSPRLRALVIASNTASTTFAAPALLAPQVVATAATKSFLFMMIASLECRNRDLTLMRTLRPVAMCKWIDRADAEPLYKRALAMLEKALGPEHPHVAASLNNLAELYRA